MTSSTFHLMNILYCRILFIYKSKDLMEENKKMNYTKYNYDKKVYIIGKNLTSKSELEAEWKDDVGIPTAEFDTENIIKRIKKIGGDTNAFRHHSFVVSHNKNKYVVMFYFTKEYEIVCLLCEYFGNLMNNLHYYTKRDIRKSLYLITDEDIDAWERSKKQITENFGLHDCDGISITIF